MEEDGLVKREVFAEVPLRVEYSLTELGESMRGVINALADFGYEYKKAYKKNHGILWFYFIFALNINFIDTTYSLKSTTCLYLVVSSK